MTTARRRRGRMSTARCAFALGGLLVTLALHPGSASAGNYNIWTSLLCCEFVATVWEEGNRNPGPHDFQITEPYADRRVKWNYGNNHTTRVSYNLEVDYSIYEVTEIPLDNHVAHHFTQAHPGVFRGPGDWVVVRARNLGPFGIDPHGQVFL